MSGKNKQTIRSATGRVLDSSTVKLMDESSDLKPDDVVVVIHAEDYKQTFEMMMKRISEMDEKVNDQSKLLNENTAQENKGFIGRFRKSKD
jgi:hypothetical protein